MLPIVFIVVVVAVPLRIICIALLLLLLHIASVVVPYKMHGFVQLGR